MQASREQWGMIENVGGAFWSQRDGGRDVGVGVG